MNPSTVIFFVLAVLLVLSSLMVVFVRNVVHAAVALVAALLLIAIFFITLQAPMVGVLQVMVYAGAIMVLFLFVIMFLNPMTPERPRRAWWALGTILAVLLGALLLPWYPRANCSPTQWLPPNYSAVRKAWPRVYSPNSCCLSRSLRSCFWWRLSAGWYWPSGSVRSDGSAQLLSRF